MVNINAIDPGQAGREGRGENLNVIRRPQNPQEGTVWKNPATGMDETFSNGVWTPGRSSTGLQAANNLSDVSSAATSRTNLGLGSLALQNSNNVNFDGRVRLGGLASKNADYAMGSTDCAILATGGAAGITITLPAANTASQLVIITKVDAGVGVITVSRAGADAIEGATSVTLTAQYDKCVLYSDGAGTWHRLV